MTTSTARIAVSSWSLDRTPGRPRGAATTDGLPLLQLASTLRQHDYQSVQLCHFHLPATTPDYLAALRATLKDADMHLDALLLDDGDLTDPEHGKR